LACTLQAEMLVILSNIAGVCHQDGSVVSTLTLPEAQQLREQSIIPGGMIPKIAACLEITGTVPYVYILDGREPHVFLRLLAGQQLGTRILARR
jgi:acetylglutamate kinase